MIPNFNKLLKNRYALSVVVTTLIILVVSILLASVVTYFAINVVSTRSQEENLNITKQHIWVNPEAEPTDADYAVASLMVVNTGGRDVVFDKLTVRGKECSWNDAVNNKFVVYKTMTGPITDDLPFVGTFDAAGGAGNTVTIGADSIDFTVAQKDLVLPSGCTMLVYIINPDSIAINDIGLTASITLYTAQAMYYKEVNVQAYSVIT
jgi:hypothetical protein